jgi:hypothetical protein
VGHGRDELARIAEQRQKLEVEEQTANQRDADGRLHRHAVFLDDGERLREAVLASLQTLLVRLFGADLHPLNRAVIARCGGGSRQIAFEVGAHEPSRRI